MKQNRKPTHKKPQTQPIRKKPERKNIFFMQINKTPQCMSCMNMQIRFIGDVYHQFVWCKKKHQIIHKMPLEPECHSYLSDLVILYGEKIKDLKIR